MKIKFCGAAESVTGSCHLLEVGNDDSAGVSAKILLDCGQFQGSATQEAQNFEPFPFIASDVDFLILSHAHIDHCGRIPLLVKRGFKGRIFCTDATADLLGIMLRDSAYIHEKEAEWKSRKAMRAGKSEVQPLFTMDDVENALNHITPLMYDEQISPTPEVKLVFNDAGHILGSAIVELWITEKEKTTKLVFTGDLGVQGRPLLNDPTYIKKADVVIMESTYGNRVHESGQTSVEDLANIIERTTKRGGTVVIPSFAVGRTQDLIYELNMYYEHKKKGDFGSIKVYIDSPMATSATDIFKLNTQDFDENARAMIFSGDDPLDFVNLSFTRSVEESKALNADRSPKVIISASGMCEAGRIRHHLKHHLWDPKSSIVFVGYQGEGTLGRRIIEGAKTVMIFGEEIYVNAEIHNLQGFSAHADRDGLLDWIKHMTGKPKALFLVHGEESAKNALAEYIHSETGIVATVIEKISEYDINEFAQVVGSSVSKMSGSEKTEVDIDESEKIFDRIRKINDNFEKLLYDARLALNGAIEEDNADKVAALNNLLLSLDKDTIKLASELTKDGTEK